MLHLAINPSDGTPLYLQIVRQIKHLVATNRLEPGDELPAVRVLAQQLVINPNTVVRAYRELASAGLIFTMRGSGAYISDKRIPYSTNERRRILSETADALIVESRNLGFAYAELLDILAERNADLGPHEQPLSSGEDSHERDR